MLVLGESKTDNRRNTTHRNFLLNRSKVKERVSDDHLGVKACIFDDDTSGIEERLAKGRQALNATSIRPRYKK